MENLISLPRARLLRVAGYAVGLSVVLLGVLRARTLWPWVQRLARRLSGRALTGQSVHLTPGSATVQLTDQAVHLTPGSLDPTSGPPPNSPLPQFVSNSNNWWMYAETARQQHTAGQVTMMCAQ